MRTVLTDLDLSMIVSVPTSRRPTALGSTLYLRIKLETTDGQKNRLAIQYTGGGTPHTSERHGVDVLPVVCERHVGLAKANGVFALGNTVIDLEVLLRDALEEGQKSVGRR